MSGERKAWISDPATGMTATLRHAGAPEIRAIHGSGAALASPCVRIMRSNIEFLTVAGGELLVGSGALRAEEAVRDRRRERLERVARGRWQRERDTQVVGSTVGQCRQARQVETGSDHRARRDDRRV